MFRGILFTGFCQSWSLGSAGAFVLLLFVAAHFSEITGYGPAVVGVVLAGTGTLVARIATRSLVPAIALHASYNLCLVAATYLTVA